MPAPKRSERPSRIRIAKPAPVLDNGRYAVKRTVGDTVAVSADIFRDGHEKLKAVVKYKAPGGRRWLETEMRVIYAHVSGVRWAGEFTVETPGTWQWTAPDRVEFLPSARLPVLTDFRIIVKGGPDGPRTAEGGFLDEQGYLRLTGRLKELINRGGEKISPIEVDTVLMDHPAVAQCLTFAMPHPMLGEEIAAAIVLREGANVREQELRDFASERLAGFKVPRKLVFLNEIPKGATGKLQRIGLADKLGLSA